MKNEEKDKKKKRILIIIIILLLLALIILFFLFLRLYFKNNTHDLLHVSSSQTSISDMDRNKFDDEPIYIQGHGEILINDKYPYIALVNVEENLNVYLSYDVYHNDKLLFSTDLISPGKEERFNIYNLFKPGQYTLDYFISAYDMQTREAYWKNVKVKQKIKVE